MYSLYHVSLLNKDCYSTSNISPCSSGLYSLIKCSENERIEFTPRTSSVSCGIRRMWKSWNRSKIWSMYRFCIFRRAIHFLQHESQSGNTIYTLNPSTMPPTWLITTEFTLIPYLVSCCTRRSVSYTLKNSWNVPKPCEWLSSCHLICSLDHPEGVHYLPTRK